MEPFSPESYHYSVAALGYISVLMLVQLLIADVFGIRAKHVPGAPVEPAHENPLFRVVRTVGNTNESIAIFLCALLFSVLSAASPTYTAYSAWGFAAARTVYAICYYANLQTLRSIAFGFSLAALVAMIIVGVFTG